MALSSGRGMAKEWAMRTNRVFPLIVINWTKWAEQNGKLKEWYLQTSQTPNFKVQQGINKNCLVYMLITVDPLIPSDQLERLILSSFLGSDHSNARVEITPWPFIEFEHIVNVTISITPGM